MKKKTLFIVILLAVVAATSIYVGNTYAKYISTANGSASVEVADWAIKVNTLDMTSEAVDLTSKLQCELTQSDVVVDGKIAPGRQCFVDVAIDPTGTEVALDYAIALADLTGGVDNLSISSVRKSVGAITYSTVTNELVTAEAGAYKGSILLPGTENNRSIMTADQAVVLRVFVDWPYSTDETNDTEDTVDGIAAGTVTVPVSVTLTQKAAA